MNCERCGATAPPGSERCAYCGGFFDVHPSGDQATQPAPQPVIVNVYHTAPSQLAVSDKKRWTAFFLCLFLGWMGVHKFYLGKIGMGVLYFFHLWGFWHRLGNRLDTASFRYIPRLSGAQAGVSTASCPF